MKMSNNKPNKKQTTMKKYLFTLCAAGITSLMMSACGGKYDETPKINDGYASKFILPSPTLLTAEEKAELEALRKEYNESIANE